MRILCACHRLKVLTGSEVYFLELSSALAELGYVVTLTAPEIDRDFIDKYTGENVFAKQISEIYNDYDLTIMSHHPSVGNFLPSAPIVNVIHSEIYPLEVPFFDNRVKKYVGIRPSICEKLINDYNINKSQVKLIRNPINLHRFNTIDSKNEKFGLFVGTLGGLRIKPLIHFAQHCRINRLKSVYIGAENEKVPFYDEVLGPQSDIEKYFKNCSVSGGIIFGRSYYEARLCGKPTIEYMVDNQGAINDIHWEDKPTESELINLRTEFNKIEVAKKIISF